MPMQEVEQRRLPYMIGDTSNGQIVQLAGGSLKDRLRRWLNTTTLSVGTTAVGFPESADDNDFLFITVEVAAIRYSLAPQYVPTATTGHIANVGDTILLQSPEEIDDFKAIARDGVTATLTYSTGQWL